MPNIVERFEFICETDKHRYYVSNQGYVLSVSSKSFKERRLKRKSAGVHQIIMSRIEEHSKKPDETRNRIIELVGNLPRIELFARQQADGWHCWGNEV